MSGATAYSSSIHETESDNKTVLSLIWKSGLRSYKKRFAFFKTKVRNGAYPAHLESLWIIMTLTVALHFSNYGVPFNLVSKLIATTSRSTIDGQVMSCFVVALGFWITICIAMRYTLKLLLMYKGFMFETRGKAISLPTKVWAAIVKVFVKWNTPSLYSFQGSLPRLPLPSVEDTMTRYLRSVQPLLDEENFKKISQEAEDFKNGVGKKLQRYLILKSWWSSNYVTDWWEQYVYLRNREPLMVGSNYYGSDSVKSVTQKQSARAANMTYLMLQYRKKIERQELKPIMAQGLVPLCSMQYERLFNTTRVPGIEQDQIIHYDDIKHVVVYCKGCYFKMPIYHDGRLLKACELQYQIEEIIKKASNSSQSEKYLASLTAWNRTKWAEVREKYFSSGVNKTSLHDIESSAFVIALDDEPYEFDLKSSPTEYGIYGRQLLHGKGHDRWFDKSFNLCVGTNGKSGVNGEHTWADAPVLAQLYEDCLFEEYYGYDANGNTKGSIDTKPPSPTRLDWDFSDQTLISKINEAYNDGQKIIGDVDHQVLVHDSFGKGFIKTCRLSPDGYIQMALQLAYYRDFGKFTLTYEASMTRLFRDGRTETVRSCTNESSAWVKAMEDKNSNTTERIRLLRKACDQHQVGYLDAMCGRGVDRHLFCLYVVSKYLEVESPFLKEILNEPWRLSTSQTPLGQTPKTLVENNPNICSASGGFGPVFHEGYSVSYIIYGDSIIFFHVSSAKSFEGTSTDRFTKRIVKAMDDIKLLFEDYKKLQ